MMKLFLKRHLNFLIMLRAYFRYVYNTHIRITKGETYGQFRNVVIEPPVNFTNPSLVYLDRCKIRRGLDLINNTGKFVVKKYSAISLNCTVVTGNHRPTVGVPHIILGSSHINDKETDIIIEEEVWVGVNCTLLPGARLGRGSIVGACSMVNKEVPPYAVVVGTPAKIIASVFSLEQILEHERQIYPVEERFSQEYLEDLFAKYFEGKKSTGIDKLTDTDREIIKQRNKRLNITY